MTTSSSQYSFGEALAAVLAHCGITQTALAKRVGCHRNTIRQWICGDHLPDKARLEDIIGALKCSPEDERLLCEVHAGIPLDRPTMHNFPFGRTPFFTGREALLQQLQRRTAPGRRVAITQAITGLGGVGKTTLALEYAHRYRSDYSHVLWATADSRTTLLSEFVNLAHDLDLLPEHIKDQSPALRALRQWLRTHSDWLLILDNVEDLSLVDGRNALVPPVHSGTILLTTRVQATEPIALPVEIACMSEEEGALLLLRRSGRLPLEKPLKAADPENYRLALELSRTLGGLPLALDQAGAYIQEYCTFAEYLSLYRKRRRRLLSRRWTTDHPQRSDHPDSVETTFSLAFARVEQESPAAADALRLCALLAPEPIPEELFLVVDASSRFLVFDAPSRENPLSGTALQHISDDRMAFYDAIAPLCRHSLVRRNLDNHTLSMHRLVQAVLRDSMTEPQRQQWEQRAVAVVAQKLPRPLLSVTLEPHALECAGYIEKLQLTTPAAADLVQTAGWLLQRQARLAEATPLYERAVQLRERFLVQEQFFGPKHDHFRETCGMLGLLYYRQRRYSDAARLWERSGDPPAVAAAYSRQGRYAEAERVYRDAIRGIEETVSQVPSRFDPEEPVAFSRPLAVAYYLDRLAALYSWQGRYAEAEQVYQDAIHGIEEAVSEGTVGPGHQWTAAFYLARLAALYSRQGRYSESEELAQRAISLWKTWCPFDIECPRELLDGDGFDAPDCSCEPDYIDPFFGGAFLLLMAYWGKLRPIFPLKTWDRRQTISPQT